MDRVRFGRALGYGARHAAKTFVQAVDAASAPAPASRSAPGRPATHPATAQTSRAAQPPKPSAPPRTANPKQTVAAARQQAKGSFVAPIAKFSGTLWLQVTGCFFALVALTMASAAWRARAAFHAPPSSHAALKLYAYIAVFVVFAYFAISSFVRAERR